MSKHQTAVAAPPRTKKHMIAVNIPAAKSVVITGDFCHWAPTGQPLHRDHNGGWSTTLLLPPGRYEYRLLVDGEWRDDPSCTERVPNGFGTENCVLRI